jgi:hypothetical protein
VLTESDKRRIFQEHIAALLREEELLRERIREEEKREDLQRLRDFEKFLRDKLKAGGITADTKWKDLRQVGLHCIVLLFTLLLQSLLLLVLPLLPIMLEGTAATSAATVSTTVDALDTVAATATVNSARGTAATFISSSVATSTATAGA